MILVGHFDSPFVRRVAVTLNHYNFPFTRNPLSIFRNAAALEAVNPLSRVPALILDDGETLCDSAFILDYLDELAGPDRALTPPKGRQRREVLHAVYLAAGLAEKVVQVFFERYFHPGEQLATHWETRLLSQIATGLKQLEEDCGAPWYLGSKMTQADVTITCMLMHMKLRVPECFSPEQCPKLQVLSAHAEAQEAFAHALPGPEENVPHKNT
jgi:glutathione S-transferase